MAARGGRGGREAGARRGPVPAERERDRVRERGGLTGWGHDGPAAGGGANVHVLPTGAVPRGGELQVQPRGRRGGRRPGAQPPLPPPPLPPSPPPPPTPSAPLPSHPSRHSRLCPLRPRPSASFFSPSSRRGSDGQSDVPYGRCALTSPAARASTVPSACSFMLVPQRQAGRAGRALWRVSEGGDGPQGNRGRRLRRTSTRATQASISRTSTIWASGRTRLSHPPRMVSVPCLHRSSPLRRRRVTRGSSAGLAPRGRQGLEHPSPVSRSSVQARMPFTGRLGAG